MAQTRGCVAGHKVKSNLFLPIICIGTMLAIIMLILQFLWGRLNIRIYSLTSCRHFCNFFQNNGIMDSLMSVLSPGKRTMVFAKYCRYCLIILIFKIIYDKKTCIFFISSINLFLCQTSQTGNFPINVVRMGCSVAGNPSSRLCPAGCPG